MLQKSVMMLFYGCNLPESVKKELAVKFGSFIFDEYYK